jgi:predicted Zn-dependent protease
MKKTLFLISLVFCLCGCATVYNPATGRKEMILITSAEEVQIGRSFSQEIIKKEKPPLQDAAKQRYVQQIGQRIVAANDRKDIVYQFTVLDSPDLNAFALPGGFVYIYRGLLEKVDEDELAAILAHEVGHIAAKHSVKQLQAALGYNVLLGAALVGLGAKDPGLVESMAGLSNTVYTLLSRGYSREDEFFADKLAVKYTSGAGYDPQGMVRVLELLNKDAGPSGRVFEILSTHPRMVERIDRVKKEIAALATAGNVV